MDLAVPSASSFLHRHSPYQSSNSKQIHSPLYIHFKDEQVPPSISTPVNGQITQKPHTRTPNSSSLQVPREDSNVHGGTNNCASLLQASTNIQQLHQIHAHMLRTGHYKNAFLITKLLHMYSNCGSMGSARLVFDRRTRRNALFWNVMIRGYARNGLCEESLRLYYQMQQAGFHPDKFTFPFILKACAGLADLQKGKEIHKDIVGTEFEWDVHVGNALIHMYAKCGSIEDAREVFDKMCERNLVSWTAMFSGYVQNGLAEDALMLFHQMQLGNIAPDSVTMVSAIQACAHLGNLQRGQQLHGFVIRKGLDSDLNVQNSLVVMYGRGREAEVACKLFDKIQNRDIVSWNSMVSVYAQNGHANEALELFVRMQFEGVAPDAVTIVTALQACADLGVMQHGKLIHDHVIRAGFESNVFVGNSLVTMYAKCGSVSIARQVFDRMLQKNVITWSAMIAAYGINGLGEDTLALFTEMQQSGVKPNDITFVSVLSACSHAGLVDEAWKYFNCMSLQYGLSPKAEHYACMVDLLGRAGQLAEAQDFIDRMPFEPAASVWGALLGARYFDGCPCTHLGHSLL